MRVRSRYKNPHYRKLVQILVISQIFLVQVSYISKSTLQLSACFLHYADDIFSVSTPGGLRNRLARWKSNQRHFVYDLNALRSKGFLMRLQYANFQVASKRSVKLNTWGRLYERWIALSIG